MLILAWSLAVEALILFIFAVLRLMRARRDAKFLRRVSEAVDWNPAGAKYPPTLTDAEVEEFHRMRWEGD